MSPPVPTSAATRSFRSPRPSTSPFQSTATLDSFNEFKIVFQRAYRRADKSAKLAIDRFILMPRITRAWTGHRFCLIPRDTIGPK